MDMCLSMFAGTLVFSLVSDVSSGWVLNLDEFWYPPLQYGSPI